MKCRPMNATKKKAKPAKVRVSICIDEDGLEFFKRRASRRNASPYQTQINAELRAVMEDGAYAALVKDPQFIAAVAEQLRRLK